MDRGTQNTAQPGLIRVPGWERYRWLRAGFSTRQGGGSSAYGEGEGNLGWTAEDDPGIVAENRARFAEAVVGAPTRLVTVGQVHGSAVRDLESEPEPWMTADGRAGMEGDGLISRTPGRLLAILTADCVPVLLADTRTHAVGALHAGWRGTLARIVQHGVAALGERYGSEPGDIVAAIGPCIGACCFEVGEEVHLAFAEQFPYTAELFRRPTDGSALHMDLETANRRQLMDAGIPEAQISSLAACTACARLPDGRRRFFSYRAERGRTGRMLSAIAAVA